MHFLPKFFIVFGFLVLIFGGYLIVQRTSPRKLSFAKPPVVKHIVSKTYPQEIIINSIHIDLPIYSAQIINNNWETTTEGVSYLTGSPIPGDKGNSILYGHNWESLLGRLPNLKPGQIIEIVFSDKSKKKFLVKYTTIVTPDNVSILAAATDKRITIYTCTGFMDTKRFVAVAVLAS